jgi:hypothetical protein
MRKLHKVDWFDPTCAGTIRSLIRLPMQLIEHEHEQKQEHEHEREHATESDHS